MAHVTQAHTRQDPRQDPRLDLAPASARRWLFALTVVLPIAITGIALAFGMAAERPKRLIAGSEATTWAVVLGGLAALVLILWVIIDRLLRWHRLTLDASGLDIRTSFYRRTLALAELELDAARVVALHERTEFKPMLKLNGIGLPGFHSGWYRLRDRSRAFVAITRGPRVWWIPTRKGHALLLQPRQPQALFDALRAMAGEGARG